MATSLEEIVRHVDTVVGMDHRDDSPEDAHIAQDAIYVTVLRAVADGHEDAQEMAAAALRMAETGGTRWYA